MVRGTEEGQSPEKGKAKSSGLDPSSEGPSSRPENSVRISGTRSGRVVESSGPLAGSAELVETSVSSMGLAGPAEGRWGPSADSGRISEETRLAVGRKRCHKCKSCHHLGLSNEVKIWVEAEVKTGKTLQCFQKKYTSEF